MRTRSIILAAALIALGTVLAIWARSFRRMDVVSSVRDDGSTRAIVSYQGALHLLTAGTNGRPRPAQRDVYRIPPGATYATLHRVGSVQWQHLGFARVQTSPSVTVTVPGPTARVVTVAVPTGGTWALPYGPSPVAELAPWLQAPPYDALIIPCWAVALLVASYLVPAAYRAARAHLRRHRGRCPECGYDLRASPDRCPECGGVRRGLAAPAKIE